MAHILIKVEYQIFQHKVTEGPINLTHKTQKFIIN